MEVIIQKNMVKFLIQKMRMISPPPMHTRLVIRCLIRFSAACKRPRRSRKSLQRADPITVPKLQQEHHSSKITRQNKKRRFT